MTDSRVPSAPQTPLQAYINSFAAPFNWPQGRDNKEAVFNQPTVWPGDVDSKGEKDQLQVLLSQPESAGSVGLAEYKRNRSAAAAAQDRAEADRWTLIRTSALNPIHNEYNNKLAAAADAELKAREARDLFGPHFADVGVEDSLSKLNMLTNIMYSLRRQIAAGTLSAEDYREGAYYINMLRRGGEDPLDFASPAKKKRMNRDLIQLQKYGQRKQLVPRDDGDNSNFFQYLEMIKEQEEEMRQARRETLQRYPAEKKD
jgi:hypothetical protein